MDKLYSLNHLNNLNNLNNLNLFIIRFASIYSDDRIERAEADNAC